MKALELKVAVELMFDDFTDTRCVFSANQLSWMQTCFLAVVSLYIEESLRTVVLIVAQSIELFDPSKLFKT